jgi:hypothetical protein
MYSPTRIDASLLALAKIPIEERVFLAAPKGGQFNFLAFEDELLNVVREKLPREHAPYVVTFTKNDLVWNDRNNKRTENFDDFQGWLKNMTFRIWIWPESTHRLVTQRKSWDLMAVVGSLMVAVEHCPLELFGQNKIVEDESRIWVYGSVRSYYENTSYINTEGTSIYSPIRRGLRNLCSRATILHFAHGEETELKGHGMSDRAADFLARLPGAHKYRAGSPLKSPATSLRSGRRR